MNPRPRQTRFNFSKLSLLVIRLKAIPTNKGVCLKRSGKFLSLAIPTLTRVHSGFFPTPGQTPENPNLECGVTPRRKRLDSLPRNRRSNLRRLFFDPVLRLLIKVGLLLSTNLTRRIPTSPRLTLALFLSQGLFS
jgi:hypothetical protein